MRLCANELASSNSRPPFIIVHLARSGHRHDPGTRLLSSHKRLGCYTTVASNTFYEIPTDDDTTVLYYALDGRTDGCGRHISTTTTKTLSHRIGMWLIVGLGTRLDTGRLCQWGEGTGEQGSNARIRRCRQRNDRDDEL